MTQSISYVFMRKQLDTNISSKEQANVAHQVEHFIQTFPTTMHFIFIKNNIQYFKAQLFSRNYVLSLNVLFLQKFCDFSLIVIARKNKSKNVKKGYFC